MAEDKELRETVRVAFACYDDDNKRDFREALHVLDRDDNGVIDRDEFSEWWAGQTGSHEAAGEVEKTLARLKDLGHQRFRVDIHTACWSGFEDVVARLVEDGDELISEKDASEYGNSNSPLHYAAYQGHTAISDILVGDSLVICVSWWQQ
ncbi:hypothetical protein KRP22_009694 [Phytophthora ramorum]|nr:hypothetical protein KRP22_14639 [Phytophthora ramorum]